jgi:predicted MFS family arabinose efflux permease
MSRASINYGLVFFGIALTASAGTRLGHIVGVTWEFAAFATGILVSAVSCAWLQTKKRIDDLEKKVTELEIARRPQL